MAEGFLGRWSQRKQQVRSGRQPEDPLVEADSPAGVELPPAPVPEPDPGAGTAAGDAAAEGEAAPAPTLVDVQGLTPESDFKPFVGRSVAPEVRNAAMKKLFTDPHFNVMDRLDTYIDDYSIADPIPEAMLRQMVGAKFLHLFDDDHDAVSALDADAAGPATGASSAPDADVPSTQGQAADPLPSNPARPQHDNPDL